MATKRTMTILKVVFASAISIALSFLGNAATTMLFSTSPPPTFIASYVGLIGPAFGIVALISILCSLWLLPTENASTTPSVGMVPTTPTPPIMFPCPVCNHNTLKVHGRTGNDMFLVCEHCWKSIRVTYNGSVLERLFIPGVITLVGAAIILEYLHTDPTDLFDIFTSIFF
jgi:hypothetical protein